MRHSIHRSHRQHRSGVTRAGLTVVAFLFIVASLNVSCEAIDPIIPGQLISPFPTFENLSFEWEFGGDDNSNASVDVQYRPVGGSVWSPGMPLRRVNGGTNANAGGQSWTTKYSGSLFGLQPGTPYEVQLNMQDPNGGSSRQTLNVSTRDLPNFNQGTIVDLPPGPMGALNVVSGTPSNPRIYRSQSRLNPTQVSTVNMEGVHDVYILGLDIGNPGGTGIRANGARDFVIAGNTINARYGVRALGNATNGYIADNHVQGESVWMESAVGAAGDNIGEGIEISGPGNVVAFNTVRGFRDNISTLEFEGGTGNQRSIDIHNNEIMQSLDDAIEADFAQGNVRVYENRITDAFIGVSTQPTLGGPTYVMRNAMYNIVSVPFKPNRFSDGDVIIHNTVVKAGSGLFTSSGFPYSNALFRNNLAIGGADVGDINGYNGGNSRPADLQNCDGSCDYDYDAVGVTTAANPANGARIYNPNSTPFLDVEPNGMIIEGISATDMGPLFPGVGQPTTKAAVLTEHSPVDLRLGDGTSVEGQAEVILGINDDFLGSGPDMGAFEVGQGHTVYGQRNIIPGDYNFDWVVDAGDFTIWRDSLGQVGPGLAADGDGDHQITMADYDFWVARFGTGFPATVPEPTSAWLICIGGLSFLFRRRFVSGSAS